MCVQQLEESIALEAVAQREEGVSPGNPQELPLFGLAAGRGARRLSQHEVSRCLDLRQPGHGGDDVLVPVQDEQVVDLPEVLGILVRAEV